MDEQAGTTNTKKKWYQKFKVVAGLATVILDVVPIVLSITATSAATQAAMMKLATTITVVGVAIISGHSITNAAYAIKK